MILKLIEVRNAGDYLHECVIISVLENGNLSKYAIANNSINSVDFQREPRLLYVFPDKEVSKGDYLILSTLPGSNRSVPREGITDHYFYWIINKAVWKTGDEAHILTIAETIKI